MRLRFGMLVLLGVALGSVSCRPGQTAVDSSSTASSGNGRYSEKDMSSEMQQLRNKWFAVETPEQVHAFLTEIEKVAVSGPTDAKYFALQFAGMKDLQGMVWRLEKLADSSRGVNSLFLTASLGQRKAVDVFLPLKNWKALSTYFTEPLDMPGEPKFVADHPQFQSVSQLQAEVLNKLLPKFLERTEALAKIDIPSGKPVVWDNSASWSKDSFADNLDRFAVITNTERDAELANRYLQAHNALVFAAFNLNDFSQVATRMGRLMGVDGFLFSEENGVTPKEKGEVLRQFPNYLKLQNGALLSQALNYLRKSVTLARKSWKAIQSGSANEYAQLNPGQIKPFSRVSENALASAERALAGRTSMRSRVTGQVVDVDVPAMYTNPPNDLKVFLPVAYHQGDAWQNNASGYKVRNYLYGTAMAWNVAAFKPYFPSVESSPDIEKAERILAGSWGGGPLASMLSQSIF